MLDRAFGIDWNSPVHFPAFNSMCSITEHVLLWYSHNFRFVQIPSWDFYVQLLLPMACFAFVLISRSQTNPLRNTRIGIVRD